MSYKNEWFLLEANDEIDEIEHREPTEEFLFYRAVSTGDIETVRKNCEQGRFMEGEGVGVLSRDPVVNLKYHFVINRHPLLHARILKISMFFLKISILITGCQMYT